MINLQYKLTAPLSIGTFCENMDYGSGGVLVRPGMLSICKADIRYYFGLRNAKILKKRLPLALIHEACGTVLHDESGCFSSGQTVILLPNIPGKDERYGENYRTDSLFRSSRADGFMQEMLCLPPAQLIPYHAIEPPSAAITEFLSVGVHAVTSYQNRLKRQPERIAVWGDGALGYVICCLIRCFFPKVHLTSVGVHRTKQEMFAFADECLTVDEISDNCRFDDVFECVGGQASGNALSQMIDSVCPEGLLFLLGVSEEPVPVNTRMVLEKGLTLVGRSRSAREDFEKAVELMETDKRLADRIGMLISEVVDVRGVNDIHRAFNQSKIVDFKLVMDWNL